MLFSPVLWLRLKRSDVFVHKGVASFFKIFITLLSEYKFWQLVSLQTIYRNTAQVEQALYFL